MSQWMPLGCQSISKGVFCQFLLFTQMRKGFIFCRHLKLGVKKDIPQCVFFVKDAVFGTVLIGADAQIKSDL
jgi:hypothetical protein